jgi:hypothetical protein
MSELTKELINVYDLLKQTQHYLPKYKLLTILNHFKNRPYSSNDNLITYSLEHFDCVTFIEVVCALLLAKDLSSLNSFAIEFEKNLIELRYFDAPCSLLTRNHFTSLDWARNNKRFVQDVTRGIFQTKLSRAVIDKASWFLKNHKIRTQMSAPTTVVIPYIDNVDLLKNFKQIVSYFPIISIVNIVRPDWQIKNTLGTNLDISHLGFAIKNNNNLNFWHASSNDMRVVNSDLDEYIIKQRHISSIKGINVQSIPGIN